MGISDIQTTSLAEALSTLEELALRKEEIIFRGHGRSDYRICSTLSRYTTVPHKYWDQTLDGMLAHFLTNLRSIGELPGEIAKDRRARLEYGRHYGVPSPLIDFSLSPYIARFFAFDGTHPSKNQDDDPVVVCALNVTRLGSEWARSRTTWNPQGWTEQYNTFMLEHEPFFENGYPPGVLKYIRFPASWNKRMHLLSWEVTKMKRPASPR